jgi:hypothetical protein
VLQLNRSETQLSQQPDGAGPALTGRILRKGIKQGKDLQVREGMAFALPRSAVTVWSADVLAGDLAAAASDPQSEVGPHRTAGTGPATGPGSDVSGCRVASPVGRHRAGQQESWEV